METVISLAQNLSQHFPTKMVGKDDTLFVQNFQFNLTAFLVTLLVSLIIAPFVFVLIGLIMFSGEKKDKSSKMSKNEVKKASIKTVPFATFIWIFIQKRTDVPKTIEEIVKRFGLAFKLNILGLFRNVCINDPVMLKKLDLFTEPVHLHKPSWYHKIMPSLIANGSTTTPVQREALLQAFNNKNVESHLKIFEKHSKRIRSAAQEESNDKKENRKNSKRFEMQISKCSFDMFADISFGNEVDLNSKEKAHLFDHFERARSLAGFCLNHYFILPSFLWALHPVKWYMDRTFRQILKVVNKITQNAEKSVGETTIENAIDVPGKSLMEVMSKAGLSNEEISAEVVAFIAWGHGTVTTTLNKLMFHLSDNKEYQHTCQQEINRMFQQMDKSRDTVEITNEALNKLKLLNSCIQECLRLYPTFQLFSRQVKTTVQLDENLTIPAGTNVLTCHWLLHRNPENYPNPDTFNPTRFLPDNSKKKDIQLIQEYMTCSLGPTNCIWHNLITQQLKVFASEILRDLEVYTDTKIETLKDKVLVSSTPTRDAKLRRRQFN